MIHRVLSFCALLLLIAAKVNAQGKIAIFNFKNNDCSGRIDSTFYAAENCFPHDDGTRSIRVFCDFNSIFTQFYNNPTCSGAPALETNEDFIPECFAGIKTQCSNNEPKVPGESVVLDFYNDAGCSNENARATFAISTDHCAYTGSTNVYARADCDSGIATINYYSDSRCRNRIEGADTLQVESSCTAVTGSPSGAFSRYGAHMKLRECRDSGAGALTFSVMLFAILGAMAVLLF